MDITALCIRLLMDVLVLLVAHGDHRYFAQKADAAFPRVSPNRLQFFEYETVSVSCEEFTGLTEWRVMARQINKEIPTNCYNWDSSASFCTIFPTFERHSGKYWCEDAEGNTSTAVNITVTAGSVILEVPARPVVEGSDVTLHCRIKETQSKHTADFNKDGVPIRTLYGSQIMNIQNVSKSDEGLYRCGAGAGESPGSWLVVLKQSEAPYEDTPASHSNATDVLSWLWIVVCVLLVALLLLVMGLLLCMKHRVLVCFSSEKPTPGSQSIEDHTVSGEDSVADPHHATYAVVQKQRKKTVSAGDSAVHTDDMAYAVVQYQGRKKDQRDESRAASRLPDDSIIYSLVSYRPFEPDWTEDTVC